MFYDALYTAYNSYTIGRSIFNNNAIGTNSRIISNFYMAYNLCPYSNIYVVSNYWSSFPWTVRNHIATYTNLLKDYNIFSNNS